MAVSLAPTKIYRGTLRVLWPFVITALRPDVPLPERLLAIEVVEVNLDQALSSKMNPQIVAMLFKTVGDIITYMRNKGFEVSSPVEGVDTVREFAQYLGGGEGVAKDIILKWFREEMKRKKNEGLMTYVNRVAHLCARLLAFFALITAAVSE